MELKHTLNGTKARGENLLIVPYGIETLDLLVYYVKKKTF